LTVHELNTNAVTIGKVRRGSFYSFIAFLAISALLAIASVLTGSFGEFEAKVPADDGRVFHLREIPDTPPG
jgi:hypothetical protein